MIYANKINFTVIIRLKQFQLGITVQNTLFFINFVLDLTILIQHIFCNIFSQFNSIKIMYSIKIDNFLTLCV